MAGERQAASECLTELTPADMPEPSVPADPARLRACGVLFMTLDRWAAAGSDMPFTWAALQEQASLDAGVEVGAVALEIAKSVMGPAWAKIFGGTDPGLESVVARQVAHALYRQLSGMKARYELGEETRTQAETNFVAIRDGHKRYRCLVTASA